MAAIRAPFASSYVKAIRRHSKRRFLTCVERSQTLSKTFSEFDADVQRALTVIEAEAPDAKTVVTLGSNHYLHVVYLVATLLSGKTLFPVNPKESPEFVASQLKRLPGKFALFRDASLTSFSELGSPFRLAESGTLPRVESTLREDFIHVLTSGSTGVSKIVRQTEAGVLANVEALIRAHALSPETVIGTCLPVFHVNALEFSLFCALLGGAELVLFEDFSIPALAQTLNERAIHLYSANPQILKALTHHAEMLKNCFSSLRYFVSAAAPLSTSLVARVEECFAKRVIQGYGLSEAVNFSCLVPPSLSDSLYETLLLKRDPPSIGAPLWGNSVHILAEDGSELGPGARGEIALRGFNVMASYLGDPPPGAWLRTGDLGYFERIEGVSYFFVTGRKKDVAKRSGESIPLREIDDQIAALHLDCDAIAVPFANSVTGEEIGLLCRSAKPESEWLDRLIASLMAHPAYRRPKVLLIAASPPGSAGIELRTSSGKPLRWKNQALFEKFKDSILSGTNVLVERLS